MKPFRILLLLCLAVLASVAMLAWKFYDRLPWVGLHMIYVNSTDPDHWNLQIQIQEGQALGPENAGLDDIPIPSKSAALKANLDLQGQQMSTELVYLVKANSIESQQYSWEQKGNKDLLTSTVEVRTGLMGGVNGLVCRPESSSLWFREEIDSPWLTTLWPLFLRKGVEPKQSWSAQVPFQFRSKELSQPIASRWDCLWTYRGMAPKATVPLAILDLQSQASSEDHSIDGNLKAEVLYSVVDQRVVASRGSFQVKVAAKVQATETARVTFLKNLQGQFQLLRLVQKGPPGQSPTPDASLP